MVIYTRMKKETLQGLNKSCLVSKRHLDAINKCVEIIQCFDLVLRKSFFLAVVLKADQDLAVILI